MATASLPQSPAIDLAVLEELKRFALHLADFAEEAILPFFRHNPTFENKAGDAGFDPVTEADRIAEAAIRHEIEARYPGHGIIGEEFGIKDAQGPFTWILDPIDGTRPFMTGGLHWGSLIGLQYEGTPVLGVMVQPCTKERFIGVPALGAAEYIYEGATLTIQTRATARLSEATLSSTHPDMFQTAEEKAAYRRLAERVRVTLFGGDCYGYCLIALGTHDLVIEADLKPYDIAPIIPIIEAAGGAVATWQGASAAAGGRVIAAANRTLLDQALAAIDLPSVAPTGFA